jgi:cell division protein FtsB
MMKTVKIETFEDIVRALRERPEWLEEMRRLILTEELLSLPKRFDAFVEREFKPLKQDVEVLKQDVGVLKQDVGVLKQDVEVLKQDVEVLKQDVEVLKQDVEVLKQDVKGLKIDVSELKGESFERRVRERAPAYLGRLIRRCRVISFEGLADALEDAIEKGLIREEDKDEALMLDCVATGFLKDGGGKEVVLALEVSVKADVEDVERASRRADILSQTYGRDAIGIVIGREITDRARQLSDKSGVIVI